jgi:hypothetical protein
VLLHAGSHRNADCVERQQQRSDGRLIRSEQTFHLGLDCTYARAQAAA